MQGRRACLSNPGYNFTVDADGTGGSGDAFYGLLGTYNGAGPAYLLAQHQSLFGQRRMWAPYEVQRRLLWGAA